MNVCACVCTYQGAERDGRLSELLQCALRGTEGADLDEPLVRPANVHHGTDSLDEVGREYRELHVRARSHQSVD